ncbi:TraK protein (plasmid) [Rickettsiales bacterium Ac37b]|nr:TraK protein [Rickettsiales bacterium Ac37b]
MLRQFKILLILLVLISISKVNATSSYEDQHFIKHDNDKIVAFISKGEINRIKFEEDVAAINVVSGELEYNIIGKDIYIRPLVSKPINFFITLTNDVSYKFLVSSENVPSAQIFIHKNSDSLLNVKDSALSYGDGVTEALKSRISKIIEVALRPSRYLGYEIRNHSKRICLHNRDLKSRLVSTLSGDKLYLEKIIVKNVGRKEQVLNLSDLMDSRQLASYVSKERLMPGELGILIRIYGE